MREYAFGLKYLSLIAATSLLICFLWAEKVQGESSFFKKFKANGRPAVVPRRKVTTPKPPTPRIAHLWDAPSTNPNHPINILAERGLVPVPLVKFDPSANDIRKALRSEQYLGEIKLLLSNDLANNMVVDQKLLSFFRDEIDPVIIEALLKHPTLHTDFWTVGRIDLASTIAHEIQRKAAPKKPLFTITLKAPNQLRIKLNRSVKTSLAELSVAEFDLVTLSVLVTGIAYCASDVTSCQKFSKDQLRKIILGLEGLVPRPSQSMDPSLDNDIFIQQPD